MSTKLSPRERAAQASKLMSEGLTVSSTSIPVGDVPKHGSSVQLGLNMAGQTPKVRELEQKYTSALADLEEVRAELQRSREDASGRNDQVAELRRKLQEVTTVATAAKDELAAALKATSVARLIDPKIIRRSRWANRMEQSFADTAFEALKDEISSSGGNVQAIKIRPLAKPEEGFEYEIVFGHRRHQACMELGIDVLAFVADNMSDADLFQEMDRENRQRADLKPYEQGVMYNRALEEGLFPSQRKLAEALGVDLTNVGKYLKLARLPQLILAAFESPLVLQQRWATELADAVDKRADHVIAIAKDLANRAPRLPAAKVSRSLVEQPGEE